VGGARPQGAPCGARLVEVAPEQRAPVIRAYLMRWGRRAGSRAEAREARFNFGVSTEAPLREIQDVAEHYRVFRIEYVGDAGIRAEKIRRGRVPPGNGARAHQGQRLLRAVRASLGAD